jgi:peptide methionine sulfoxide reductase MsrA
MRHFVDEKAQQLAEEIKKIVIARKHKPFQPATEAHKRFLKTHLEKAQELQRKYPFLNLDEDIRYFLQ